MKISTTQYARTLFELTDNKSEEQISGIVQKFAEQLKKDGQLKNIKKIIEKFLEIYNEKNGIVVAEIVTRQTSKSLNVKEIEEFIAKKYNAKKVEMNIVQDEKIKGGIIIRVGDDLIDGSIQKQLTKLKKVLYS